MRLYLRLVHFQATKLLAPATTGCGVHPPCSSGRREPNWFGGELKRLTYLVRRVSVIRAELQNDKKAEE